MASEREGAPPLPGRRLSAHSRCRPCTLRGKICDFAGVAVSLRVQIASGGRGASPPDRHRHGAGGGSAAVTRGQADFAAIR